LYETPVFLLLGVREIVTRAFLPVKSLQNLDQEWSSYLTDIAALQKAGGFAYVSPFRQFVANLRNFKKFF